MALVTGTFEADGFGDIVLLRPGQSLDYTITVGEGDEFIGIITLLASTRTAVWAAAQDDTTGNLIEYIGTEETPLEGSVASGTITNNHTKDEFVRFSVTDFDGDDIGWTLAHDFAEGYGRGIDKSAIYADLRLSNGFCLMTSKGTPVDGTSGTGSGYAGPGSICVDVTNAIMYINTNTAASPLWAYVGLQST